MVKDMVLSLRTQERGVPHSADSVRNDDWAVASQTVLPNPPTSSNMASGDLTKQLDEDFVGDAQFCRGQTKDVAIPFHHTVGCQAADFFVQVDVVLAFDAREVNAC